MSLNPAEMSAGFLFRYIAEYSCDAAALPRRADRTQHRLARPAVHLQPGRFLVGAERGAGLHSGLAVDLVGIETDAHEVTLHGFDVGGAQLGRGRPRRGE